MKSKKKLTRLCSFLLVLVMMVGLLPATALAEEVTPETTPTTETTPAPTTTPTPATATATADFSDAPTAALALLNAAKTGTEDSTWDSVTKTLTLNGVNFKTINDTAVELPAYATIVLNGENTITGGDSDLGACYGIYTNGPLTIEGSGKLTVTGGTSDYYSYGIYGYNNVTISDNADVTATGGTADCESYGINVDDDLIIEGNAKVKTYGGVSGDSYGIYAGANVKINGGEVIATGGEADDYSYGIHGEEDVTITGGTVTAIGGATNDDNSYGIYGENVIISGGIITATGGAAYSYSLGIYADIDVTISDGTVTATGGTAESDCDSNGICADDNVTIDGGTVTAIGGTAEYDSIGISADNGAVNITGGIVKAEGGAANNDSIGIYSSGSVTFNNCTLIAKATDSAMNKAPSALPSAYRWRISEGGVYSVFPDSAYTWNAAHTYLEIRELGYIVTFDSNGGTGTMTAETGVSGTYTLPANGFTAPVGKQFKGWATSAGGAVISDATITVAADTTLFAVWENIPAASVEYDILDGANSKWTQNSNGSLSIRGSGAFSKFVGVKVDGTLVDAKNYTVKEGSTIVTLKADYLKTLSVGTHTLEILWTDGSASTRFTVDAKAVVDKDTQSPKTGDNSHMALWITLFLVSGVLTTVTGVYGKKKKLTAR